MTPPSLLGALAPMLAAVVLVSAGCSDGEPSHPGAGPGGSRSMRSSASAAPGTYGALPTFLPSVSGDADAMLTGSPRHPAVTSQGDRVLARVVGGGTVQAQVSGPVVPGAGLPHVAEATTCTWTVTFDHATTPVPLRLGDFLAVDDDGHAYRLQYAPHTAPPPATLRPGHRATFALRVVMNTGEGVMRWQPGGRLLALWDFVVEND